MCTPSDEACVAGTIRTASESARAPSRSSRAAPSPRSPRRAPQYFTFGVLLALAPVGLSLIYGTTGLSNFAQREQGTRGGKALVIGVHHVTDRVSS